MEIILLNKFAIILPSAHSCMKEKGIPCGDQWNWPPVLAQIQLLGCLLETWSYDSMMGWSLQEDCHPANFQVSWSEVRSFRRQDLFTRTITKISSVQFQAQKSVTSSLDLLESWNQSSRKSLRIKLDLDQDLRNFLFMAGKVLKLCTVHWKWLTIRGLCSTEKSTSMCKIKNTFHCFQKRMRTKSWFWSLTAG